MWHLSTQQKLNAQAGPQERCLFQHVYASPAFIIYRPEQNAPIRFHQDWIFGDIVFHELNLVVEIDGAEFHHTPEQKRSDELRSVKLQTIGYKVIRFSAAEVESDFGDVVMRLLFTCKAVTKDMAKMHRRFRV